MGHDGPHKRPQRFSNTEADIRVMHYASQHQRCSMCGDRLAPGRTVAGDDGDDEFCSKRCAGRWDRREREKNHG